MGFPLRGEPGLLTSSRAWLRAALVRAALSARAIPTAAAQDSVSPPRAAPAGTVAVQAPEVLLILVRSSLIALHQANVSGNYTVLRDIGAPGFAAQNSAARLAEVFAPLRLQRLDLLPVAIETPQITEGPAITQQGLLALSGSVATRQALIRFQLLFQPVAGQWQLFGLAVQGAAPEPAPLAAGQAGQAKPASPGGQAPRK